MLERRWEVLTEAGFTPIEFKDLTQGMIVRGFEENGSPVKSAEGGELHSVQKPPFIHPETGILTVGMLPVEVVEKERGIWRGFSRACKSWSKGLKEKLAKWGYKA